MARRQTYDSEKRWYAVHTYSGYENKVKTNLELRITTMGMENRIFQVLVPTETKQDFKKGKKEVERKIFPGYILVEMMMSDEAWSVVRNTPGVTGFVGLGNQPTPLMDHEVQEIMQRMGLAKAPKKPDFFLDIGQQIKVMDGPFTDFTGIIREINMERQAVKVMLTIFGRETPVELNFNQVEEA